MKTLFSDIDSDTLKEYIAGHREDSYELVDVRQEREYKHGHIAGAKHVPLGELGARIGELSVDRDVIFYCHSGKRSKAAALFYSSNHDSQGDIYNLSGGILSWSGLTLTDIPELRMFDLSQDLADILYTAMDLERGAWDFYSGVLPKLADGPLASSVKLLAQAEEGHARMIYNYWAKYQDDPKSFEELYENLPGNILEGGKSVQAILNYLDRQEEDFETMMVEMALMIEYSAYDLYRVMAHRQSGTDMEKPFLVIAQAEKEHMRIAADALRLVE